jgi:pimeloyl-ACP methyl ester carboxylesterase
MENLRRYGNPSFRVALVHGGPGAAGEMAPLALGLTNHIGIIEPFQTKMSVEDQVEELKLILEKNASLPVILVGFSWGAWLSFIVAARYASFVKKLIMIGSPPFEEIYAKPIMEKRISRLEKNEAREAVSLIEKLNNPATRTINQCLERFGKLMFKADSYNPLPYPDEVIHYQHEVYRKVWAEADKLRKDGILLKYAEKIRCPVVAIHGDYDPHPVEGVQKPLTVTVNDFRLVELKNCGHHPWLEKHARDIFFRILKRELEY